MKIFEMILIISNLKRPIHIAKQKRKKTNMMSKNPDTCFEADIMEDMNN
jgi:hypothetical protein